MKITEDENTVKAGRGAFRKARKLAIKNFDSGNTYNNAVFVQSKRGQVQYYINVFRVLKQRPYSGPGVIMEIENYDNGTLKFIKLRD